LYLANITPARKDLTPLTQAQRDIALIEPGVYIVGGYHPCALRAFTDEWLGRFARGWIQVRARLVEQKKRRIAQHGPCHREALDHSLREA
jgi:hypothetical protein